MKGAVVASRVKKSILSIRYGACLMVWLAWAHSFTSKQYQYFPENGVSSPALKFCNVCRPVEILRRRVVGAGGKSFRH